MGEGKERVGTKQGGGPNDLDGSLGTSGTMNMNMSASVIGVVVQR